MASEAPEKDKSKVHKLSLKGSAKLVAEFVSAGPCPRMRRDPTTNPRRCVAATQFQYSIHTILYGPSLRHH